VLGPKYLCGALAYDHTRRRGVSSCDALHDGSVSNTEVTDSIDLKSAVDNRHGITSLTVISDRRLAALIEWKVLALARAQWSTGKHP